MGKGKKAARKRGSHSQSSLPFFENVHRAKIKVVGIGGGGGNIVSEIASRVQRFDFVAANTDSQALKLLPKKVRAFPFGQDLTQGLGCGMDADLGERAAKAEKEKIKQLLEGSDVCILVATLGGGTGSGAAPAFAEIAQELRVLCVGIFTLPFAFEGERRQQIAQAAVEKAKPLLNAYAIIPNEHIFHVIEQKTPLREALSAVNRRLSATLEGFVDTLALPGLINIDFADVRSTLEGKGSLVFINSAVASGPAKAQEAAQAVLVNPLYGYTIEGAERILFNVSGDRNLKMQEVAHVSSAIAAHNPKARIIFGIACNSKTKGQLKITLFAVGCNEQGEEREEEKEAPKRIPQKRKRQKETAEKQEKSEEKTPEALEASEEEAQEKQAVQAQEPSPAPSLKRRTRRSALEVKKAVDQELKEMAEKESVWDIPAFLRNKS